MKSSNIPHELNKQSEQPAVSEGAIPLNEISQDGSLQLISQSDTQKVLGSHWDSTTDTCNFSVRLNFSPKRRKAHTGPPNLRIEQITKEIPVDLTKRMILSQVNGIYDSMGLATLFPLKAKILMRKLWSGECKSLGWDEPIPQERRRDWINFFRELFKMQSIFCPKCIKPKHAIGEHQ